MQSDDGHVEVTERDQQVLPDQQDSMVADKPRKVEPSSPMHPSTRPRWLQRVLKPFSCVF